MYCGRNSNCLTCRLLILSILLSGFSYVHSNYSQSRRILPADSYRIIGKAGLRRLGQCNISYAWLAPPPTSSLDAYGHALACTRLQLLNGNVIDSKLEDSNSNFKSNKPEEELKRINTDIAASMIDLNNLDALLRAEQTQNGQHVAAATTLADETRYFYLADRIGSLNVMVLLRPGQQIKLELIDPVSPDHLVTPQHVLCTRKECVSSDVSGSSEGVSIGHISSTSNSSRTLSAALSKAERYNRELYLQLIISRVACALLSFLCIVFAITSLTLCVRLRKNPGFYRKKAHPSELSVCRDQHSSPTYIQANGKLNIGQPSPVYFTDTSPKHVGLAQIPGDSASVTNLLMTASNLSECGGISGIHGGQLSYAPLSPQYTHMSGYPISAGRASLYNDSSGMFTFVPVTTRAVLLPYQNGSASPVPSNHSIGDVRGPGIVRSGSLGRYSGFNIHSVENGRRKLTRLNKHQKPKDGVHLQPHTSCTSTQEYYTDMQIGRLQNQNPGMVNLEFPNKKLDHPALNDLISFQHANNCTNPEAPHPFPKVYAPCASTDGDKTSIRSNHLNHMQESCATVVRKPALVN